MEYYLCRAMSVCQLDNEQLMALYAHENNIGRALYPFEIQEIFKQPTLKEYYGIPVENDIAQDNHNQKLRTQFRKLGLKPKNGDLSTNNLEEIKTFDEKVRDAFDTLALNLEFSFGKAKKRNVDQLNET